MPFNPQQLAAALLDPAIVAMNDADAAVALSMPILTPKLPRITYTIAGAALGAIKAITLRATLLGVVAANNALSPAAGYVHDLLSGPGFDAGNPEVQGMASQFVANNLLTVDDANTLLYDTSYRCGGPVTADDVTTARVAIARQAAADAIRNQWAHVYNAGVIAIDVGIASGTLPTLDSLRQGAAS